MNDRIGLVVFSGAAYTQAPLTLDYDALKMIVGRLRTRILEDGTAIGDALATSLNRLRESEAKSRVIVLITDGDNNAGQISPLDSASMAQALQVPIYAILIGKDATGTNPALLQQLSARTGGELYRATDPASLKEGLQKVLDTLRARSSSRAARRRHTAKASTTG